MIGLFNLLVMIIILGLVFYLLYWLIGQIPLPAPFAVIAKAVLALAIVILLLGMLFGSVPVPRILVG